MIPNIIEKIVRIFKPKPHDGQVKIIQGAKRFNVIANGRRWGKTILAVKLSMETMLKGQNVGYFAPDPALFEDFWEELKERLEPITIYKSESKHTIRINTGGEIKLWSLEKKNAGRSKKYHRVIIDEAAFAKNLKYQWEKCIRATLTDYQGDAFFFSSPAFGTFFQEIFDYCKKYSNWASFQMPTSTNPYISPEELKEIEETTDPLTWAQEYLAQFVNLTGLAFMYSFKRDKHVKDFGELREDLPVYLSFDFNISPMTCIASQHPDDHSYIYTRHEFRLMNSDIYEMCDAIMAKLGNHYFIVTGDASGKNGTGLMKNLNYYTVIRTKLDLQPHQFKVPSENPGIANNRVLCNSILYRHPKVMIHPECEYLIKDMERVQVLPNGDIDKKTDSTLTHLLDTYRYYLNSFFRSFIKLK